MALRDSKPQLIWPPPIDLAPILSLPDEILILIFLDCLILAADPQSLPPGDAESPPEITLSHVCRQFRDVIVATPAAWTNIYATLSTPTSPDGALATYLQRSGEMPLTLRITVDPVAQRLIQSSTTHLFRMLNPHSSRWSHLFLKCGKIHDILDAMQCLDNIHIPLLRSLHVSIDYSVMEFEGGIALFNLQNRLQMFVVNAPLLNDARFKGIHPLRCLTDTHALQSLHIHEVGARAHYSRFQNTLQNFHQLTHLVISGGDCVESWPTAAFRVDIPSLRSLHIGTHPNRIGVDLSEILKAIVAPLLRTLVLEGIVDNEMEPFFEYIQRMHVTALHPQLQSLYLGQILDRYANEFWKNLCRAFPTINHFGFYYTFPESLLSWFDSSESIDGMNDCWPGLQVLTLTKRFDPKIVLHAAEVDAQKIVNARIRAGYPLQMIRMSSAAIAVMPEPLQNCIVEEGEIHHQTWSDIENRHQTQEGTIVVRVTYLNLFDIDV